MIKIYCHTRKFNDGYKAWELYFCPICKKVHISSGSTNVCPFCKKDTPTINIDDTTNSDKGVHGTNVFVSLSNVSAPFLSLKIRVWLPSASTVTVPVLPDNSIGISSLSFKV